MIHSDYGDNLDGGESDTAFTFSATFEVPGTHTIEVYGGDHLVEDHISWTFSVNDGED